MADRSKTFTKYLDFNGLDSLGRNHDGVLGKSPNELEGLVTLLGTVDAFRIGEDVGVERDLHPRSS